MTDEQLTRYSRHILLNEIGIEGQARIQSAHALIVGAGGLGSPAALYLASAGIGRITLVDNDRVDLSNLQRQILHVESRIGQLKVQSAQTALAQINPATLVTPINERLAGERLNDLVANADLVLDCCDNFATRYALNHACVMHQKPLVSGAAIRFSGQLAVFDARKKNTPCYHCLFPEGEDVEEMRCAITGVFAPLTGIIGACQAAEALKIISGAGEVALGRLLALDALTLTWRSSAFKQDPKCEVCAL